MIDIKISIFARKLSTHRRKGRCNPKLVKGCNDLTKSSTACYRPLNLIGLNNENKKHSYKKNVDRIEREV